MYDYLIELPAVGAPNNPWTKLGNLLPNYL